MARAQVQAAGGIVLRRKLPARVAVVRLRKRDEWVLPKGKLDPGETPRAAARREVLEETGHNVTVREFLGTLVYETGGRAKVVHYWSMEAGGEQTRALMSDILAVDWLPLNAAVERLSRDHERTFLETVGPLAIGAHTRRLKAKSVSSKSGGAVVPVAVPIAPLPVAPETIQRASELGEMSAVEPLAESEALRMGVEPAGSADAANPADRRRRNFAKSCVGGFVGRLNPAPSSGRSRDRRPARA